MNGRKERWNGSDGMSRKQGLRAAGMRPSAIAVGCMSFHGILDIGKMSGGVTRGH